LGVIEENYNSIKKLMRSGFSFINSYIPLSSNDTDLEANLKELQAKSTKNNELFDTIEVQLEECSEKLSNFATNIERLAEIYKANSEVSNIESSIDSVLKLSSKMSSSRSFS
jgi:predicted nuclease with TOPRIM domain